MIDSAVYLSAAAVALTVLNAEDGADDVRDDGANDEEDAAVLIADGAAHRSLAIMTTSASEASAHRHNRQ